MRRRGRVRRVGKWGGLAWCITIVLLYAASGFWGASHDAASGFRVGIGGGVFWVGYVNPTSSRWAYRPYSGVSPYGPIRGWSGGRFHKPVYLPRYMWWFDVGFYHGNYLVQIPLWFPFLIVATPTAFLWHRDRRRFPRGHCQARGYDLTGNVSGRCSECGHVIRG